MQKYRRSPDAVARLTSQQYQVTQQKATEHPGTGEHLHNEEPGAAMAKERAVLAGGCFWGMQDLLRRQPGVLSTRAGFTGGRHAASHVPGP